MELPHAPSDDQLRIIDNIRHGCNVCVTANPGSGKTTLCLHIMKSFPEKQILALTFSKLLQMESKEKHDKYISSKKSSFMTIDGISYALYGRNFVYDECKNIPHRKVKTLDFDILILDELQDIGMEKYKFICYLLKICTVRNPIIVTLGDPKQTIFKFMRSIRSDNRFLSLSENVFNWKHNWLKRTLYETFRMSKPITDFVNRGLLCSDDNIIISNKFNPNTHIKPRIYFDNYQNPKNKTGNILTIVIKQLLSSGYKVDDIMIISPYNTKSNSVHSISETINDLSSNYGINFYLAEKNSQSKNVKNIRTNKISVLTIHGSKGMESKVVIRLGFNQETVSQFHQEPEHDHTKINNLDYVSCTRAEDMLILFTDNRKLPVYTSIEKIHDVCDIFGDISNFNTSIQGSKTEFGVLEFIEKLDPISLVSVMRNQKYTINSGEKYNIGNNKTTTDIQFTDEFGNNYIENFASYYGTAVPSFFELKRTGKSSVIDSIIYSYSKLNDENFDDLDFNQKYKETQRKKKEQSFKDLLYKTSYLNGFGEIFLSIVNGHITKDTENLNIIIPFACVLKKTIDTKVISFLRQFKHYDWFNVTDSMMEILDSLNLYGSFEINTSFTINYKYVNNKINGIIDYMDDTRIIEFKVKRTLDIIDYIQVLFYKYSVYKNTTKDKDAILINLATKEHVIITMPADKILNIIIDLLDIANSSNYITDTEFVKICRDFVVNEQLVKQ